MKALGFAVDGVTRTPSYLDQAIEERQPMVLWHRVMGVLPREEPWVRERFRRVWPEASIAP